MTLAQARPEERDGTLLRAATALFCQEPAHDRDAVRRYEQLAIHLLPKLKPNDRAFVASLLGGRQDAPPSVMRLLARDAIGVAGPVLRHSKSLSTIDLLGVIATTGVDHHQLIAGRPDLSADVLRALEIAKRKPSVDPTGLEAETDADSTLTQPAPPTRPKTNAAPAYSEFLKAPTDRRLRILGEASDHQWRAVGTNGSKRLDQVLRRSYASAEIVVAAKRRDRAGLVAAFTHALGISSEVATQLLSDPSGEPLVLMARAAGLSEADGRTVLLLANKQIGESVDAFLRLADLYASLEASTAEAFIEAWRPTASHRQAKHSPVYSGEIDRGTSVVPRSDPIDKGQKRALQN
jgi:uncharacterized protein (DUF2336 family)